MNFWAMINSIVTSSISKGQFPLVCVTGIAAFLIHKTPEEHIPILTTKIIDHMAEYRLIGYFSTILVTAMWIVHSRYSRKIHVLEMERVSSEKTRVQGANLKIKTESSRQ